MSSTCEPASGTPASGPGTDGASIPQSLKELIAVCASFEPPVQLDPTLTFKFPVPKLGYEYWLSKSEGAVFPERAAISPVELARHLPNVGLFDVHRQDGRFEVYCRLAGEHIEQIYGKIHRRYMHECLPEEHAVRFQCYAAAPLLLGGPVRFTGKVAQEENTHLNAEMLIAPLQPDEPEISPLVVFVEYVTTG